MQKEDRPVYEIDGKKYCFNRDAFRAVIKCMTSGSSGQTRDEVFAEISERSGIPVSDLKLWAGGELAPKDADMIKRASKSLGINDKKLCRKSHEMYSAEDTLNRWQRTAVKKIYDELVWFLEEFCNSDGFRSWYDDFAAAGSSDPEAEVRKCIRNLNERISAVICQEYFDLHGLVIYDRLYDFFYNELPVIYEERIGQDCRYEGDTPISACEDYADMMQKLNAIIF